MSEKVYISGKISGLQEKEAFRLFEECERSLLSVGYTVVNPMRIQHNHDKSWESYMKEDIKALCDCAIIIMLENWETSRGARTELFIAETLKMKVLYQSELMEFMSVSSNQ